MTDRVLLQREVAHVKADSDAQATALLDLLKVDPAQLEGFLNSADIGVRKANAMLGSPGKDAQTLRTKVDGVFREMHALKGEAMALGLGAFGRHIHAIEDLLAALRQRDDLTGNEFVPGRRQTRRADGLPDAAHRTEGTGSPSSERRTIVPPRRTDSFTGVDTDVISTLEAGLRPPNTLPTLLKTLTETVAADCHRSVQLVTSGLDMVPARLCRAGARYLRADDPQRDRPWHRRKRRARQRRQTADRDDQRLLRRRRTRSLCPARRGRRARSQL